MLGWEYGEVELHLPVAARSQDGLYQLQNCGFKDQGSASLQSGIVLIQWFETIRNTNPVLLKSLIFFFLHKIEN